MSDKLIPDAAVQAIQDSVRTEVIDIFGMPYTTRPLFLPPQEPRVSPLKIHTLSGLVDYITQSSAEGGDGVEGNRPEAIVHVLDHETVEVISAYTGRESLRNCFVRCSCERLFSRTFDFGIYYPVDQFIVALQSLLAPTEQRAAILQVVGNIREENVRTVGDDGVTQQVTARAGIARVENVEVPNPVELRPYRTFREIDQPDSLFILRLKSGRGDGELPTCALFEADGGAWKLEAIQRIRNWLSQQLEDVPIIA